MFRLLSVALTLAAVPAICAAQALGISEAVRQSIHDRVDHGYNVGIVVGVVNPQGTYYYEYGRMRISEDGTPDEDTVFEIGSITKVFTSILLADMIERGELALEDPIERYLPDRISVPTRSGEAITLEHLATHSSGLPRMPTNFSPADPANPFADYTVEQAYEFLDGYGLPRDIGVQYEYSNYGAGLLGHILAERAGVTYEELVAQRIAEPLDMPATRITLTTDLEDRLAAGHAGSVEVPNWDIPTLAGAGALRSTARDMLTFLSANLGLTESDLFAAMQLTHEPRRSAGSPTMQIGLGWHIRNGNQDVIWHNGGTGGYRSFAGFVNETQTGVVVLTNTSQGADDIGFHLLDSSLPLNEIRQPVEVAPEILERYVGRYELAPGYVFEVTAESGRLFAELTGQPRFPVYPESETTFYYTVVEAQITFEVSESGEVTGLVLHQNGDHRARKLP
jgi:CubicO group peptidase (beta-lactamase class C family)